VVRIDTLEQLDRRLAAGASSMNGWNLHTLDLTHRSDALRSMRAAGALFLGCDFADGDEEYVRDQGAIVFPQVPGLPVDPYRTGLYSPSELYDVPHYRDSLDAKAYAWSKEPVDRDDAMAITLHDQAIDDALAAWVTGRDLVGVMGGHDVERGEAAYTDAVRLGHALGQDRVVATGGGPGAMEAANLGAWLSPQPGSVIDDAVETLAAVPSFRPDIGAWVRRAFEVRDRWPGGADSLGIPTWHYGHEPPNPFASAIAKYFHNATREAILLEVCAAGIVFLPGAGGTVQEIFQDACENYYADESSVAPMVLVGRKHWTEEVPAWPLLKALSRRRPMEPHVHLVDTVEDAVELICRPGPA
jgi:predicted Rossmann-fold nucleotide-binding protein